MKRCRAHRQGRSKYQYCHRCEEKKPEKKAPLHGSFFSYRPSAGTAPSAQHAFGALRLRRPPSQLDRPCAPPGVPLTTGLTLRLSTYSFTTIIWVLDRTGSGNVGLTHFLMKHLERSGKNFYLAIYAREDKVFLPSNSNSWYSEYLLIRFDSEKNCPRPPPKNGRVALIAPCL